MAEGGVGIQAVLEECAKLLKEKGHGARKAPAVPCAPGGRDLARRPVAPQIPEI